MEKFLLYVEYDSSPDSLVVFLPLVLLTYISAIARNQFPHDHTNPKEFILCFLHYTRRHLSALPILACF